MSTEMTVRRSLAALFAFGALAAPASASVVSVEGDHYVLAGEAGDDEIEVFADEETTFFRDFAFGVDSFPEECSGGGTFVDCPTLLGTPQVKAGAGDDYIDVSDESPISVDCGPGDDLYAATLLPTTADYGGAPDQLQGCEAVGAGPGVPVAGDIEYYEETEGGDNFFRLKKRRVIVKGLAVCSSVGKACKLRVKAFGSKGQELGTTKFKVPAGSPHQIAVKLTKAELAKLKGGDVRFNVSLSKPGSFANGRTFKPFKPGASGKLPG